MAWHPLAPAPPPAPTAELPERQGESTSSIHTDPRRNLASGLSRPSAIHAAARPGAGTQELARDLGALEAIAGGVGPVLNQLLSDSNVSDVLVNAGQVWVDRGEGLELAHVDLGGDVGARALAVRMAAVCGKRLDEACPVVDGTLPDGVRLHAVLEPLSASGTLISLRTSRPKAWTLAELVDAGTIAPALAPLMEALVATRANTLISGSTGSGKTTLLASLLGLVDARERMICIEEAAELRPTHPHVIHLQERRPNVQGVGEVSLADLVRAAMRMRPDRLILGECRGAEVRDVLTALNTGHDGGWATIHANTAQDVPARLAALGALAGMNEAAIAAQGVAALDAVVQLRRAPAPSGGGRRVSQLGVFQSVAGRLESIVALDIDPDGSLIRGAGWEQLAGRVGYG